MRQRRLKLTSLLFIIILNITISSRVITFAQQQQQQQKHQKQSLKQQQPTQQQHQTLLQQKQQSPLQQQQNNQTTDNRQQQQTQSIYGVRWFLGDYFAFHKPQQPPVNQQMFILMFNSVEELDDEIYLMINNTRYGCYERYLQIQSAGEHHEEHNKNATKQGESFTNAMYKCIVYGQQFNGMKQVQYQIISGWTVYEGKDNQTVIKQYRQYVLFESTLRIPQNMDALSFFFLADWGLITEKVQKEYGYKDVMPSLKKTLKQNKNIGMMIFGGDLAYDFEGQMYIDMLKYLQPITSQIVTIATPGNHQSVYHEDSLQLFAESFYSPMWYKYFNYFSLSVIEKHKLVIVSYDPENYVFPWINRLGRNLTDIFDQELKGEITQYIKKNYDVVVFSHYPVHCSQTGEHYQTCEQNKVRFQPFMKKFTQMGIDLYLSGHLHIYQRSKPLCSQTDYKFNEQNIYDKQCPVFIIQGSAGNSMWVQMTKRYEPKDFSDKIVYETGYGVVSFDKRNITYEHFQVHDKENVTLADKITLYQPKSQKQQQQSSSQSQQSNNKKQSTDKIEKTQQKIVIGLEVIALVAVGGIAACLLYQFKIKNRKQQDDSKKNSHVEMIEENFQTPTNNINKNNNMSKQQPSIE